MTVPNRRSDALQPIPATNSVARILTIGWAVVKSGRREAVAVTLGVVQILIAFVVPHLHLGIVTPLIRSTPQGIHEVADTAPIFGWWNTHVGWGSMAAVPIAIAAVLWGPPASRSDCRGELSHWRPGSPRAGGRLHWP